MALRLYLLRHAHAVEEAPSDKERPLSDKGIKQVQQLVPELALRLLDRWQRPNKVLTSPALRALQTAKELLKQLQLKESLLLQVEEQLYPGSLFSYKKVVESLDDTYSNVMIVGHNPAISDFGAYLTQDPLFHMSKGMFVALSIELPQWKPLKAGCAKILYQLKP